MTFRPLLLIVQIVLQHVFKNMTVQVKINDMLFRQKQKLNQTDCYVPWPHNSSQNAKVKNSLGSRTETMGAAGHGTLLPVGPQRLRLPLICCHLCHSPRRLLTQ